VTGRAWLWGRWAWLELSGKPAMAMALVWICLGLFVHSHFLWSGHRRLWRAGGLLLLTRPRKAASRSE